MSNFESLCAALDKAGFEYEREAFGRIVVRVPDGRLYITGEKLLRFKMVTPLGRRLSSGVVSDPEVLVNSVQLMGAAARGAA